MCLNKCIIVKLANKKTYSQHQVSWRPVTLLVLQATKETRKIGKNGRRESREREKREKK
jgi:hypothetical protein